MHIEYVSITQNWNKHHLRIKKNNSWFVVSIPPEKSHSLDPAAYNFWAKTWQQKQYGWYHRPDFDLFLGLTKLWLQATQHVRNNPLVNSASIPSSFGGWETSKNCGMTLWLYDFFEHFSISRVTWKQPRKSWQFGSTSCQMFNRLLPYMLLLQLNHIQHSICLNHNDHVEMIYHSQSFQ
jgi:hypothetical protein